jgi:hypothetical protein
MNHRDGNVAFKVTYTDSNWSGVCSIDLALKNCLTKDWCKLQAEYEINCQHSQYSNPDDLNKNFSPCYDSIAQKELIFYPGHFHSEEKDGIPKNALDIKKDKIAIFTSKEGGAKEDDRFIFAIGRIDEIELVEDEAVGYYQYICEKDSAIIFRNKRPKFWNYYTNKKAPSRAAWNSLLFRYLEDSIVEEVLKDIALTNRFPAQYRKKAEVLLSYVKS